MELFPNQEGSVSRLTTLTTVMHADLPKTLLSSSYKSQKKKTEQGRRKKEKEEGRGQRGEATKKTKGYSFKRMEERRRDLKYQREQ
jgi:hypothetical protein